MSKSLARRFGQTTSVGPRLSPHLFVREVVGGAQIARIDPYQPERVERRAPGADALQAAARDVPEELLLVETDSPWVSPPVGGEIGRSTLTRCLSQNPRKRRTTGMKKGMEENSPSTVNLS